MTGALLLLSVLLPLGMLAALAWPRGRRHVPRLLALAPLPAIAAALLGAGAPPLVLDADRLRFTLGLDLPSALLMGLAALLWSAAGLAVRATLARQPGAARFAAWWLLTMAGSLGVFPALDLIGFYLAFAVASLAAFGLVIHDRTPAARRAASVMLLLAVLGEICLLVAFALLAGAAPGESLAIAEVLPALAASPWRGLTVALLIAGFGLKAGLVPLHVWLPLAHPAAPAPASAVLSGALIKAGVVGLLRFLPADGSLSDWGTVLTALGFVTAFHGVLVGVTQANPKTVLAYSSVSQMGVVAAALGLGLSTGQAAAPLAVAFYAGHHVLAKGALFLGTAAAGGHRALWLWPALVLALGFGGLPLTGGALAKAAVKEQFAGNLAGLLAALSAMGSTVLMLHACRRLAAKADPAACPPKLLRAAWLGLAAAALLLPWALQAPLGLGDPRATLAPAELAKALVPVLLGAGLALALRRWGRRLPKVPEGDLLLPMERLARRAAPLGAGMLRAEAALRAWPAAGIALLLVVAALLLALRGPP